jgi:transposase
MISPETRAEIRRYFYAEHWKIGTIARELNVHPDTVRSAIESERFKSMQPLRASVVDPYIEFIRDTLERHPRLRSTRVYAMVRDRGYTGSVVQLRRAVGRLRPQIREPFLKLHTFPGEQAQVDWAHFGYVMGPRQASLVLLRDDAFLFTSSVSGVLLRSNDGELLARSRACF